MFTNGLIFENSHQKLFKNFQATILQQTAEHIEKLEREKKQLKRLIKLKDPNFNFEMEFVCENEEPEPIQVLLNLNFLLIFIIIIYRIM